MSFIALLIFPVLMAYSAASDLLTMRLPNKLTATVIACFFVLAASAHMPLADLGASFGCGFLVLIVGFALFSRGWIGGGDAKLAAGIAAWIGWSGLMDFLLVAALAGGALSLIVLQLRRWPMPARLSGQAWLMRLHDPAEGVPYGVALALAALHVYPQTQIAQLILQM